jgi:putative FmdB family regulatory protein
MPTYVYRCSKCGSEIEVAQKMIDPYLTHCSNCETESLKRIITPSTFVLRGSGWFKDGYSTPPQQSNK